jgi:hypothetical protein
MSEIPFAARLSAQGLSLPAAELPKLEALAAELDRAAAAMRAVVRDYTEEPSNVFRLTP